MIDTSKPIVISKTRPDGVGSGNGGVYYQLTAALGVKIVGEEDALTAQETADVHDKINASCPGVFPACYGVVQVVVKGESRAGLLLEHIPGRQALVVCPRASRYDIADYRTNGKKPSYPFVVKAAALLDKLEAVGIYWDDCHLYNVILDGENVRFVDPGEYVRFDEVKS